MAEDEWFYLDTGEIVFDHEDGDEVVIANLVPELVCETDGLKMAAARELFEATVSARAALHEMTRNYIASLPDEFHDAMTTIQAALAKAGAA